MELIRITGKLVVEVFFDMTMALGVEVSLKTLELVIRKLWSSEDL